MAINMKKTFLKTVTVMVFLGLFIPIIGFAQIPSLPHQFFGTVNFNNGVAPNGLSVEARITGIIVGSSVTANGKYGYSPNLLFATDNQGVNAGKTVEFYVSGIKANETAIFANGNSSQINLTIPKALPTTPAPSPAPTGDGGGGGTITPSTTVSPLSQAAQKVDANKDGKIDVLDFNVLMVNWGKTGSNMADFNGDGKVDIFDFNSLMINWTK